jgi:thioredoxin-dependent peroxiredoxin
MKKLLLFSALSLALCAGAAKAALKPGDLAPDFKAQAALGGADFTFSLAEALKKGPVVLYFYPKSFTRGCTIEAHEFAENYDNFAAAGASLVGVSYDPIEVQREFSTKECRDKFPVAADPSLSVISAYDAKRLKPGANGDTVADRISYVIVPDGKVAFALTDSNPSLHVEGALAFVRKWREEHKR